MQYYKIIISSIALAFFASCNFSSSNKEKQDNEQFSAFQDRFMNQFWIQNPEWATQVGNHQHDSILWIPNEGTRALHKEFAINYLDSLHSFQLSDLSTSQQIDYYLIEDQLQKSVWQIDEEKSWEWDPSSYNVSGLFAFMLSENYAPLEERLQDIQFRLKKVPFYYEAAKENLRNPVLILTDLAKSQNMGGLSVFEKDLKDSIQASKLANADKKKMLSSTDAAISAVKGYVNFLENYPNPRPRDFRLGGALYEQKFKFDIQSESTAAQIYDAALARKKYLHVEMFKITKDLWKKYFGGQAIPEDPLVAIRRMIDTLSLNHVTPQEYQSAIENQIPELVAFVKEKNLLYLDESKPLVVRREPAYMAGVAIASISAPGPYDKSGNTYYNVGNIEAWPAERAESHLREYNHYILQILNIHEAIPGHYTQLVYANQTPSIIKSVFGNGAMIEGWAVYTEQMMLENGYGNNEPEMWLMWYKWHLRTVCNAILDYSVHVKNMTEEQALHLLMDEAFQQRAEAEGKWKRVSVTSVQLMSYFTGYKEINDLKNEIQKKQGTAFNLKEFNEKFLSYGNSPVKYIRKMMLK